MKDGVILSLKNRKKLKKSKRVWKEEDFLWWEVEYETKKTKFKTEAIKAL